MKSRRCRLPGSGGAADFISYAKRTILTMRGGEFVEKLPYLTSPGYLDGGDSREKSGHFTPGSGPTKLISTQGIFEFDPVTKEMYLVQASSRGDGGGGEEESSVGFEGISGSDADGPPDG